MNIDFSHISLSIGGHDILRRVSGTLSAGKITAIIGPNGSGKSSLLSCLAGLQKLNSGSVRLGDDDCHIMDAKKRAQIIGYLPQKNEVNWNLSVRHLVDLGRMAGGKNMPDDSSDIAMQQCNITHLIDRKAMTLSGGELGRVLFARLLAGYPIWILLDEPMANLDMAHQWDMAQLLKSIAATGKNIAIILHDLNQAAQLADDVIIMNEGEIYAQGPINATCDHKMLADIFGVTAEISNKDGKLIFYNIRRIDK